MNAPLFIVDAKRRWGHDRPMCQMVKAGDFLWLTGQVAYDENGQVVGPGDLQAQARQIFTNVRRLLSLAGCDLS
jgi:2-iminobutanoate/2-iminopropanoate deaminase